MDGSLEGAMMGRVVVIGEGGENGSENIIFNHSSSLNCTAGTRVKLGSNTADEFMMENVGVLLSNQRLLIFCEDEIVLDSGQFYW